MVRKLIIAVIALVGWLTLSAAGEFFRGGMLPPELATVRGRTVKDGTRQPRISPAYLRSSNARQAFDIASVGGGLYGSAEGDTVSVLFLADADAFVRIGPLYDTENFGAGAFARVHNRNGPHMREAYFGWDLTSVRGQIVAASIRLTAIGIGRSGQVHRAWINADSDWREEDITWADRPDYGIDVAEWTVSEAGPVVFDVTNAVLSSNGRFSVRVASTISGNHNDWVTYATREASDPETRPVLALSVTPDTSAIPAPLLTHVDIQPGPLHATVTWKTDRPATSRVELRRHDEGTATVVQDAVLKRSHRVMLTSLDPDEAYHFRVSSDDGLGNASISPEYAFASEPSDAVLTFWAGDTLTFGRWGSPTRYANVLGNVAPGIVSLRYAVNGGARLPASLGPDGYRLQNQGDFNIDVPRAALIPGENTVRFFARDARGRDYERDRRFVLRNDNAWPLPYQARWNAGIGAGAEIVDGRWTRTKGGIRTVGTGYDRLVAIGDTTWSDYEVTVPVTIHGRDLEADPAVGIVLRWHGHRPDGGQPYVDWEGNLGAIMLVRWKNGNERFLAYKTPRLSLARDNDVSFAIGRTYIWKTRVESLPDGKAVFSAKYWRAEDPEPSDWSISAIDEDVQMQTGSFMLLAHHVDVTFGDVTVTRVPVNQAVSLSARVFLEGAYEGPAMHTQLAGEARLPLAHPYSAQSFVGTRHHHMGSESLRESVPADMVDWVLVELSPEDNPSARTEARSGVLLQGGEIVDLDGASALSFPGTALGRYYVTVRHRNHLSIVSNTAVDFSDSIGYYDFTLPSDSGSDGRKDLGNDRYGMYGGDADGNGQVQNDDRRVWRGEAGRAGYLSADFNLDGQVQLTDERSVWRPNAGRGSLVP